MEDRTHPFLRFSFMGHDQANEVVQIIVRAELEKRSYEADPDGIRSAINIINRYNDRPKSSILLARRTDTDKLTGMIGYERTSPDTVRIEHLYTDTSDYPTGSRLVRQMLLLAGPIQSIHVTSTPEAVGFYQKMGFESIYEFASIELKMIDFRIRAWQTCSPGVKVVFPQGQTPILDL